MTARLVGMNPKYMDPNQQHFVAVEGVSSLAKHFLKNAAHTAFSQTVQSVSLGGGAEEIRPEAQRVAAQMHMHMHMRMAAAHHA